MSVEFFSQKKDISLIYAHFNIRHGAGKPSVCVMEWLEQSDGPEVWLVRHIALKVVEFFLRSRVSGMGDIKHLFRLSASLQVLDFVRS